MNGLPSWIYCIAIAMLIGMLRAPQLRAAIVPPPWSDPSNNPCATQPGGWQLLYWAPLKKCFKIFTLGYPCPDTMELSPVGSSSSVKAFSGAPSAECRCPPGTALSEEIGRCYTLFERGPCDNGQYFGPMADSTIRSAIPKKRLGECRQPEACHNGMVFWPLDGKCYTLHTKGPCSKGKLLSVGKDRIATCMCENQGDLAQYYYSTDSSCHEHFTRGPCDGHGRLFLPGGKCGCHIKLPHYHEATDQCFELGTNGPCPMGHVFIVADDSAASRSTATARATCQCKEGYAIWKDGNCYRMYTRGPCDDGEFLLNSTDCVRNPCAKGRLYFPAEKTCYRVGSQGPCTWQQVVVFDFTARPSVDGISYNGVCGCTGIITNLDQQCSADEPTGRESACESMAGMVELNAQCYKLYSRGPCGPGQWLEPRKLISRIDRRGAQCQCRPGYTKYESDDGVSGCYAPSVGIARWFYKLFGYE